MSTYTTFAKEKLLDLYSSHDHEVGSQLKLQKPEAYKDLQSTDCITYSLRVWATPLRNQVTAKQLRQSGITEKRN